MLLSGAARATRIRANPHVVEHVGAQHSGQRADYLDDLDFSPFGNPVLQFRDALGKLSIS